MRYNDEPRLAEHVPGVEILNEQISCEAANNLGIKFLSEHVYQANVKNIIRDYPLGLQFFEEQLQNASDANAERVDFLLDHTTHGTEKIFSPLLAEFQDPAIYVHNSGQFSKEDLENIRNLGNSQKKEIA